MEQVSNWDFLSRQPRGVITDMFVMRFDKYLNWELLSTHYDFTIDLLRHYMHRVNWGLLLQRQLFPVSFLREAAPYFSEDDWQLVTRHQTLSESFVHDYADKIDWEDILLYQHLSVRFLANHKQYVGSDIPERGYDTTD